MARVKRFNTTVVNRDLQTIIRTFPTRSVVIVRPERTFTTLRGQRLNLDTSPVVYRGEALHIPGDSALLRYPMGEIHQSPNERLLVNGRRDIVEGDFTSSLPDGRVYIVKDVMAWWTVWLQVTLQVYQQ